MSYFEQIAVEGADTGSIDAFGRWRVSQVNSQFDLKQIHDALPLLYDTLEIGTGSATHTAAEARTQMTTAASSDAVIMQTFQRANYSSGKSQQLFWTFDTFGVQANVIKRVGYFTNLTSGSPHDTLKDGFWLESDGTDIKVVISQSGTTTESTTQANWNLDPLDGTGPSGLTWNWNQNTILTADFEWLGLGRVRWGVVYNGLIIYFHESNHVQQVATGVYMSSPNQPIRAEIRQTGAGSGTFNFICATVGSEGAVNVLGKDGGIDDDGTHLNANSTSNWYYAIGLRLNTGKLDSFVDIISGQLLATTNDNFLYRVLRNPTYGGSVTYNTITNYAVEYGLGATANTISAMGAILYSGSGTRVSSESFNLETAIRLGSAIDKTADEIVIAVKPLTVNLDIHRSINWRERV